MPSQKELDEVSITWQLGQLAVSNRLLQFELEALWESYVSGSHQADFHLLLYHLGRSVHYLDHLEQQFISDVQREEFEAYFSHHIRNESIHDTVYTHHKDDLIALAEKTLDTFLTALSDTWVWSNAAVGDVSEDTGEDHPIVQVIEARDDVAFMLIGLRHRQAEEQYLTINASMLEQRLALADLTLKRLIFETTRQIDYRERIPYAPPDFWWRHIPGHEYSPKTK